jgi:hypothetical protein
MSQQNIQAESTVRGVEYNIKITKRKQKDNIIERDFVSLSSSPGAIAPEELVASWSGEASHSKEEEGCLSAIAHPTPQAPAADSIRTNQVHRSIVQLFKNEDRYKLKIRLNLVIDHKEIDADFIAPLTLDRRNFKRYNPPGCEQWFIEQSDTWVKEIRNSLGVKAYRGKFHESQGYRPGRKTITQVEPWCQCAVWFNPETKSWFYSLSMYEFALLGRELSDDSITARQKQNNLHRQDQWRNPQYDTRTRPLTWAQRMEATRA